MFMRLDTGTNRRSGARGARLRARRGSRVPREHRAYGPSDSHFLPLALLASAYGTAGVRSFPSLHVSCLFSIAVDSSG